MFTRPGDVDEARLVGLLADGWGIDVAELSYLAVGFGSHHWCAVTGIDEWFVTVDDLTTKAREPGETVSLTRDRLLAALTTAAALRDRGYGFVVAPERSRSGEVAIDIDDRHVLVVYRMLRGETYGYGEYTDPRHRDAVVVHLAALHRAPAPCRRWAMTETFSIARRSELTDTYSALGDRWDGGPFAEPARRLLAEHVDAVETTFARYDALVDAASARPERFVLTHGEPHPANTVTTGDGVVLVDWDTALIAPPERDLWDLVSQDVSVAPRYESLTGVAVDPDIVELYRLAWDLTEIAIYVTDFRRPHERTDDATEAWKNLRHFIDPSRW